MEIKDYSKNYIINKYFEEKEIKQKQDNNVRFVEVGNTRNLSGYMLIKNNEASTSISKSRKKSKSHYVEVVFAGLRQPTKKIHMSTYRVLNEFIKRFEVSFIDVCFDGECKRPIDTKMYYGHPFGEYLGSKTDVTLKDTSLYVNNPSAPSMDADYFIKILLYDKYIKESRYKELNDDLIYWKRIEFRVALDARLKDTNRLEEYLDDMERVAKRYFNIADLNDKYFAQQVSWLTDKRTQKGKTP